MRNYASFRGSEFYQAHTRIPSRIDDIQFKVWLGIVSQRVSELCSESPSCIPDHKLDQVGSISQASHCILAQTATAVSANLPTPASL